MPVSPTYPGVYIEELPSAVRAIVGVSTSVTAFIGRARRGPVDEPVRVHGFGEFARVFGGLWREAPMGYSVDHFFRNGGSEAIIVRVAASDAAPATVSLPAGAGTLPLQASSPGAWGNRLRALVDHDVEGDSSVFNLTLQEMDRVFVSGTDTPQNQPRPVQEEVFRNVSSNPASARYVAKVLEEQSSLANVPEGATVPAARPDPLEDPTAPNTLANFSGAFQNGADGAAIGEAQVNGSEAAKTGIHALLKTDIFNILCIPPFAAEQDVTANTWGIAAKFCEDHRAMLVIDPPASWTNTAQAESGVASDVGAASKNAAVYFPRVRIADPEQDFQLETFVPCGVVAGVMARTDATRGVWKAPAGIDATLGGVQQVSVPLSDGDNGVLNKLGINCLRSFPVYGRVAWGARTRRGSDRMADQWKYVPVRRTALYIEESLFRGLKWAVFEPNDEPLWSQIRLNVGAFMHGLFRQGAFQGSKPKDAYLVKCDSETTTQDDINKGIVNVLVGFAPLKPAEFVILKIQQLAGQVAA